MRIKLLLIRAEGCVGVGFMSGLGPELYIYFRMLFRLLNRLAAGFYKTKWSHHLPKKDMCKGLQKPFRNWTIVRGDTVKVIAGDDRGKVGKVVKVLRKLNRIVVRGVNMQEYTKSKHGISRSAAG